MGDWLSEATQGSCSTAISFCLVVFLLLFITFANFTRIQNCCIHTSPEPLIFFSVIHSINSYQGFSPGPVFFFLMFIYLCIYLLKFLVAVGLRSCMWLSLVAVSRVYSSLQCTGFSLQWILLLQFPGSRHHKLR